MTVVASIVEGHGEVHAVPVLLRRISAWLTPDQHVDVTTPIRVHRDKFLNREDEFRRMLELAAGKSGDDGWILVLLDADDDCPAKLGAAIVTRAAEVVPHRAISVMLANREYEAWFVAGAESLRGKRTFSLDASADDEPENIRDAKGWVRERMDGGLYSETTDQVAFSTLIDLEIVRDRSRSFRKLCGEWLKYVA